MKFAPLLAGALVIALASSASAETLTIATVNNGDMVRMQGLTADFTAANPDIELQWVTLEENILRERVTTDIATKGGQFDVMTIGTYEVPIWAKQGWLLPLDNLGADYDVDDLLPAIRSGLTGVRDGVQAGRPERVAAGDGQQGRQDRQHREHGERDADGADRAEPGGAVDVRQ